MADRYAKVWTSILYDDWFIGLTAIERGIWLQLIIIAKQFGDSSRIFQRNFPALASMLGTDRKTLRRVAGKFHDDGKIVLQECGNGAVDITIVKYEFYQEVKSAKEDKAQPSKQGKVGEKSGKNPTLPDLNNTDQHIPEEDMLSVLEHYNEKTRRDYDLNDERRAMLSDRLKKYTVDQLNEAIDGITSRPYNLGQNQDNREYLDFELIFKTDSQVDKYRQDVLRKKRKSTVSAEPPRRVLPTPEELANAESARLEAMKKFKEEGLLRK